MSADVKQLRDALDVVANILTGLYVRLDALEAPAPAQAPAPGPSAYLRGPYDPEYIADHSYSDAFSMVPEGYDTVLGYLAKNHPDVLDTLDYRDPDVTQRDGFKLAHWCRTEHRPIVYVQAPPALQWAGIETVRAYPIELLERRWGTC